MWISRCYRYCDADIFLNKIHGCATVHTVGGHMHTNIYTEVCDPKDQVSVPCCDVSHVGECCVPVQCVHFHPLRALKLMRQHFSLQPLKVTNNHYY
jgi:hypothetical protein